MAFIFIIFTSSLIWALVMGMYLSQYPLTSDKFTLIILYLHSTSCINIYLISLPSFSFFVWFFIGEIMFNKSGFTNYSLTLILIAFIISTAVLYGYIIKHNNKKPIGFLNGMKISIFSLVISIIFEFLIMIIMVLLAFGGDI